MKKTVLKMMLLSTIALIMFTSCSNNSPENKAEKVEEAKSNVVDATIDLNKAIQDSINEYNKFKNEFEMKIKDNEMQIAALKEKVKLEKAEIRMEQEKELDELAEKNAKLKKDFANYKETGKDKWEAFKLSFNKGMDEVGKSISSMAKRNMR
jgi:hypothetical protein